MGFSISWIGVEAPHKLDLLSRAGLRETTEVENELFGESLCCADLPTGWAILCANDFDFASAEHMQAIKGAYPVLSFQVHEGIMYAAARCTFSGEEVWSVEHFSQDGLYDLNVAGQAPVQLASIQTAAFEKQRADDAEDHSANPGGLGVDYIIEIPISLAETFTGFRYDTWSRDSPALRKVRRT